MPPARRGANLCTSLSAGIGKFKKCSLTYSKKATLTILQSPPGRDPVNDTGQISSYSRGFSTDIRSRMLSAIGTWSSSLKYRTL